MLYKNINNGIILETSIKQDSDWVELTQNEVNTYLLNIAKEKKDC